MGVLQAHMYVNADAKHGGLVSHMKHFSSQHTLKCWINVRFLPSVTAYMHFLPAVCIWSQYVGKCINELDQMSWNYKLSRYFYSNQVNVWRRLTDCTDSIKRQKRKRSWVRPAECFMSSHIFQTVKPSLQYLRQTNKMVIKLCIL